MTPLSPISTASSYDQQSLWAAHFGALMFQHLELRPNLRILDLATGTGFPLLELAQTFGLSSYAVGLDESTILRSLPEGLLASVPVPTLVIDGEESHVMLRQAAQSLADALPNARYRTLKGQGHDIVPAVVGPVLEEFFLAQNK